jgi:hypothetical protein
MDQLSRDELQNIIYKNILNHLEGKIDKKNLIFLKPALFSFGPDPRLHSRLPQSSI